MIGRVSDREPPRILLVHNRYRWRGGEERAVEAVAALLSRRGHQVEVCERESAALATSAGRRKAGTSVVRGGSEPEAVAQAAMRMSADVVHFHNMQPLFGPRALGAARATGARVVLHLHNFRLFCAVGVAYRHGRPCHRCNGRNTLPGVVHRCRGSLGEAVAYGAGLAVHQPEVFRLVDRFITPGRALQASLETLGLPAGRASVVPNFLSSHELASDSKAGDGTYALYAGRLVAEKGADTAIAAAVSARVPLLIAGAGPDEARLLELAQDAPAGAVRFVGRLDRDALEEAYRGAALSLMPSRWEEPCPYGALESLGFGVPVLASRIGGMPEIVPAEQLVDPYDAGAWTSALRELWADAPRRRALGDAGIEAVRLGFSEDVAYAALMDAYGAGLTS